MIRRPPRSTQSRSSAASDVYKRQVPPCQTTSLIVLSDGRHRRSDCHYIVDRICFLGDSHICKGDSRAHPAALHYPCMVTHSLHPPQSRVQPEKTVST